MDYSFGNEEETAELKKLNADVLEEPDSFEAWEKLVRATETLEGGINRNSSPQAITATRDIYDRFLAKFPLFFGYWKKYADLEFSIAGTEAAEMVYERGVASISNSVDLWTNYCTFKTETSHDPDVIRELFERGASCVGLDFLAHPFWDKYLEFEERSEGHDNIFRILGRIIAIPMHQYARYFERYRQMAQARPLQDLVPLAVQNRLRDEVSRDPSGYPKSEVEIETDLRARIDAFHLEIFNKTQTETTKRWTFESEIKRPYFHVTDLDDTQLVNWRKYLDFEEAQGDYTRTTFLYERCLVTCAYYEDLWFRYARWMFAQPSKEEEVRNIYARASCLYVAIAKPTIRLQYAFFEEMSGRVDVAKDIHHAILAILPNHIETIISLANTSRRHGGLDAAVQVYTEYINSAAPIELSTKAALVAEWARIIWKVKGSSEEARQVFQKNQHWYLDSRSFWMDYLQFEIEQPTSAETEVTHYQQIKRVVDDIRSKSNLSPQTVKDLVHYYMIYLLERGTKDAAKEFMKLDQELNGPMSVQAIATKAPDDGKNGVDAAASRNQAAYVKYFQEQAERPTGHLAAHPTTLRYP